MSETKQPSFHKQLNDVGYFCTDEFANVIENALHKRPMSITMLKGEAGTGKSYLPEKIAEVLGCNIYVKQAVKDYEWDDFVQKYVPDETSKSGIKARDCEVLTAIKESKDKRVILLLDEWDKTQHSADAMFLEFLQTGRISISGKEYKANLSNLMIFFTSNKDREFSEPFVRRMKFIEVDHMPPQLVLKILRNEYKGNKDAESTFNAVMNLYNASVLGDMEKPATVQELIDVIDDWLRYLRNGLEPKWEDLVYVNVTKGRRNHMELQRAIEKIKSGELQDDSEFSKSLDVTFFDNQSDVEAETISNGYGSMPRMMEMLDISLDVSTDEDGGDVYAEFKRDDAVYTTAYEESVDADESIDKPHFVSWYTIRNNTIERSKAYELREIIEEEQKFNRLVNTDGTLVFNEPNADKSDVASFLEISENNAFVRKADENEIIFRITASGRTRNHENNVEYNVRWTKDKGCEFIVPTKAIPMLRTTVRDVCWYPDHRDRLRLDNICLNIYGEKLRDTHYVNLRTLGNTKNYLDVTVTGEGRPNDELNHHMMIYKSRTAKIKETKRTTTYDFGWAIVRSWHRKDNPNYKNHVVIKSAPPKENEALHCMFIRKKLGTNTIPLFINMDSSLFMKMPTTAEGGKWLCSKSSRILKDTVNKDIDVYCINTYSNTTYVGMLKDKSENLSDLLLWYSAMRVTRKKMEANV